MCFPNSEIRAASSIWIKSWLSDSASTHIQLYPLSKYHSKRRLGLLVTPILKMQIRMPMVSLMEVIWFLAWARILPQEGLLRVTKHFLTNSEERSCSQSELKPFSQVISLIERAWLAPSDSLAGLDRLGLPKHGKNKKTHLLYPECDKLVCQGAGCWCCAVARRLSDRVKYSINGSHSSSSVRSCWDVLRSRPLLLSIETLGILWTIIGTHNLGKIRQVASETSQHRIHWQHRHSAWSPYEQWSPGSWFESSDKNIWNKNCVGNNCLAAKV